MLLLSCCCGGLRRVARATGSLVFGFKVRNELLRRCRPSRYRQRGARSRIVGPSDDRRESRVAMPGGCAMIGSSTRWPMRRNGEGVVVRRLPYQHRELQANASLSYCQLSADGERRRWAATATCRRGRVGEREAAKRSLVLAGARTSCRETHEAQF